MKHIVWGGADYEVPEIDRSDYEVTPVTTCPAQDDKHGCEDCGYFNDSDTPGCNREYLVNNGVPCYKCGYYFIPDKEKYDEWGNSGRPFDPTDWECGYHNEEPTDEPDLPF